MSGYVYFIQAKGTGHVKIGWTECQLRGRLSACQTGSHEQLEIVGYFSGSMRDERQLHDHFGGHRLRGEWFRWNPELAAMVVACRDAHHLTLPEVVQRVKDEHTLRLFETMRRSLATTQSANDVAPQ